VLEGNVCAVSPRRTTSTSSSTTAAWCPTRTGSSPAGHENKTAHTVAIRERDAINTVALRRMFEQIIANNRAGGWRKLKRR
jgi:hypothetical protein